MTKVLTDNSHFYDKVGLRLNHLPKKKTLKVLDCYAGKGRIWRRIQEERPDIKINVLPIDLNHQENRVVLRGDNVKFFKGMTLGKFDIIDLDAYGIPYEQLKLVLEKSKAEGIDLTVFLSFIQTKWYALNYGLLVEIGYSLKMIKKSHTLFGRNGFQHLKQFLAQNGIEKITYRNYINNYYIHFDIRNKV